MTVQEGSRLPSASRSLSMEKDGVENPYSVLNVRLTVFGLSCMADVSAAWRSRRICPGAVLPA